MKATRVLTAQHRTIESLFSDLAQDKRSGARMRVLSRLAEELIAHMAGEESVLYPAARQLLGERVDLVRARGEHLDVRVQLRRVLATNATDPQLEAKIDQLREMVLNHQREEESGLFAQVVEAMTDAELEVLGRELLASRPPIWIVTSDAQHAQVRERFGRMTLPIPPAGEV
jgi:hemerythrin superfamily protein